MKRRKEVDLELQEIKQDVQYLKAKMEIFCEWIAKKFSDDTDFSEKFKLLKPISKTLPESHNQSEKKNNEKLKTIIKDDQPQEHSYCIALTPTTNHHNLYDMVEEELKNNQEEEINVSPPPGNPSILNTPKKSAPTLSTKLKESTATTSVPILVDVFNSSRHQSNSPSPPNANEEISQEDDKHLLSPIDAKKSVVANPKPKKNQSKSRRVKVPKTDSQPASSTEQVANVDDDNKDDDDNAPLISKTLQLIMCEICGKLINGHAAMKRHCQTHTNLRPHTCQECGKSFQRKFHLKTHQMTHNGEKKHMCRFCGKLFLLPKDIVAHERVHTGEKPYACEHCPRRFTLKSHLVMHTRVHTGDKPYKCDSCNKCFTQANSLRVHKKSHLSASQIEEKALKSAKIGATTNLGESSSIMVPQEDYPIRSTTNNFNVIGQLIPISLSNHLDVITQQQQLPSTSSNLRIPIHLPVLMAEGSISNNRNNNNNVQFVHSLSSEDAGGGYYDLETL